MIIKPDSKKEELTPEQKRVRDAVTPKTRMDNKEAMDIARKTYQEREERYALLQGKFNDFTTKLVQCGNDNRKIIAGKINMGVATDDQIDSVVEANTDLTNAATNLLSFEAGMIGSMTGKIEAWLETYGEVLQQTTAWTKGMTVEDCETWARAEAANRKRLFDAAMEDAKDAVRRAAETFPDQSDAYGRIAQAILTHVNGGGLGLVGQLERIMNLTPILPGAAEPGTVPSAEA